MPVNRFARKEKSGVDCGGVQIHSEMQMGSGDSPGNSDFADQLARRYAFALPDVGLVEMCVQSNEAPAMVDHHCPARKEIVADIDYFSCPRSDHGLAPGGLSAPPMRG